MCCIICCPWFTAWSLARLGLPWRIVCKSPSWPRRLHLDPWEQQSPVSSWRVPVRHFVWRLQSALASCRICETRFGPSSEAQSFSASRFQEKRALSSEDNLGRAESMKEDVSQWLSSFIHGYWELEGTILSNQAATNNRPSIIHHWLFVLPPLRRLFLT